MKKKYPLLAKVLGSEVVEGIAGIATIHHKVLSSKGGYVAGESLAKSFEEATACLSLLLFAALLV